MTVTIDAETEGPPPFPADRIPLQLRALLVRTIDAAFTAGHDTALNDDTAATTDELLTDLAPWAGAALDAIEEQALGRALKLVQDAAITTRIKRAARRGRGG